MQRDSLESSIKTVKIIKMHRLTDVFAPTWYWNYDTFIGISSKELQYTRIDKTVHTVGVMGQFV